MSDCGEEIIARLPLHSVLHDSTHPMAKIINNTIGEWLDNVYDEKFLEQFFLQEADGPYLDLHGVDKNIPRKLNESDDDYRQRLILESIGHLTINFLRKVYNVELYTNVDEFDMTNTLVSDNTYICDKGFIGVADEMTQQILNKKFVLDNGVEWL